MTKFRIMSDLHLESEPPNKELFPIPYIGEDYLILAGDIHLINKKKQHWFNRLLKHRSVIYILGNHEFYGGDFLETCRKAQRFAYYVNGHALRKDYPGKLYFLDNTIFTVLQTTDSTHNVHVIGSTLWSNIHPPSAAAVLQDMSDYHDITSGGKPLTVNDTVKEHLENVAWLAENINNHGADKCLVITHHTPSHQSVSQQFESDVLTSAYASNLEYLMKDVDLWVHGHMHESSDYDIDGCRIICNPKGYHNQNDNFNIDLMVEL